MIASLLLTSSILGSLSQSPSHFQESTSISLLVEVPTMRDLTTLKTEGHQRIAVLECDNGETCTEPLPPLWG